MLLNASAKAVTTSSQKERLPGTARATAAATLRTTPSRRSSWPTVFTTRVVLGAGGSLPTPATRFKAGREGRAGRAARPRPSGIGFSILQSLSVSNTPSADARSLAHLSVGDPHRSRHQAYPGRPAVGGGA